MPAGAVTPAVGPSEAADHALSAPHAARPTATTPEAMPCAVPRRFTITLEGHGTAAATGDERVLVALERAQGFGRLTGMPRRLPVGCRRGGCGICRMRVLDGDYRVTPMSRAHVSEADEADGVVLACAIWALSDLTLRLEPPSRRKDKAERPTDL